MNLRVALIDDHQLFRERLRALLEEDQEIEIVAEAGSGQEILGIAPTIEFEVACMDIHMPGMNGIEATRRLLALKPNVRVIGLSAYADQHYVEAMLEAGAAAYFTKGDVGEDLLRAVHTASRERPYFGADVSVPPALGDTAAPQARKPADIDVASLGAKELEVMRLIARGMASPQIADALSMDTAMVEVYRRNIVRKLQLADGAALDEYARRLDPDSN
ncbi:MAG: response regulator transcription factor [Burkholderiales bacterium]|nr:response regulator transcription factor [Burkholderiales bacterium]